MERGEADEFARREAAIASAFPPDSNSVPSKFTSHQLTKILELRRRRLEIKEKSMKIQKKMKGSSASRLKASEEDLAIADDHGHDTSSLQEDSCSSNVKKGEAMTVGVGLKKRQKLHWGLDTKERWERKANM